MSDTDRPDAPPAPLRPRHPDFDVSYQGTPPWDIGRPQPAFVELADAGLLNGCVLDVGCGTGEHALMAAGLGFDTVGVDMASTAIARAEAKARERGLSVRFVVADALDLQSLNDQFDTVLDCGLFHVFDDADRSRFVDSLRAVIPTGGQYHMLCFSDQQPGDWGPRRITHQEIAASFSDGWQIDSVDPATIDLNTRTEGAHAWHAAITRI